jgi:hypothetical protein
MLRILSYLPFIVAFALGALLVDFWIDSAEVRQEAALRAAGEPPQQPASQTAVPAAEAPRTVKPAAAGAQQPIVQACTRSGNASAAAGH